MTRARPLTLAIFLCVGSVGCTKASAVEFDDQAQTGLDGGALGGAQPDGGGDGDGPASDATGTGTGTGAAGADGFGDAQPAPDPCASCAGLCIAGLCLADLAPPTNQQPTPTPDDPDPDPDPDPEPEPEPEPEFCQADARAGDAGCDGACDGQDEGSSPDCNGVCEADDDGDGADCDEVCASSAEEGSPDCDGACGSADEQDTADCDDSCGAADAADAPDCNGVCEDGEDGSADCDGVCTVIEQNTSDCDGVCDAGEEATTDCPVDCEVAAWGAWDACSATCGGGMRSRTREIATAPANGGAACPALAESEACNEAPCPIDCEVSDWSGWGGCSAACGGGSQVRQRSVTVDSQHGGAACPSLEEVRGCNPQPCPVDCQVSDWSAWGECSAACGGGEQKRARSVSVEPSNGGAGCPELTGVRTCNPQPCPIDCQVSDWSAWGACDVACGAGAQTRTRTVTVEPQDGGAMCPALEDARACEGTNC